MRNAVIQRIELLDANFLAALNGYIQVRVWCYRPIQARV